MRAVWQGGTYTHPEHPSELPGAPPCTPATGPAPGVRQAADDSCAQPSPRERQALRLIALGHTNSRLMGKLGLRGGAALVRYALQRGLQQEQEEPRL